MLIGMGVFFTQFQYNPAVMQNDALLAEPNKDSLSPPLAPHASFVPLPKSLQPLTATEMFDAGNLSDKINGKAELYLSAGFAGLVSQRFRDKRATDQWLEVFVYDMGDAKNAFSVFSGQRRKDAEPLAFARHAYHTSNAVFMIHGRYYVEIIASSASDPLLEGAKMMAETFARNTPAEAASVNETALFPEAQLVKNSIVLIATDAFGYDGFNRIYSAEYEFEGHSLMAYISRRESPAQATELAANYTRFLVAYGGQHLQAPLPIADARLIEIIDTYEIVFTHDSYVAGIREAATIDQAKMLAMRLYDRLKGGGNESRPTP